jgi:23S rRNA U2552 (ribose-2'-O)-methylase RlmE/FtsJ
MNNEGEHSTNPLLKWFQSHREGPGVWKWIHYFEIYHRYFSKFVGRELHIMEIGVYSGGSLRMWKEYFGPQCRVYGVDIEPACESYRDESTKIFIGDQADRAFWQDVKRHLPKMDIVIDDGGHLPEQQRVSLEEMFPILSPGGIYLCEDITGTDNAFSRYLHGLQNGLNAYAPHRVKSDVVAIGSPANALQRAIRAIHFYPFVAVVEKNQNELEGFHSPKHGTHWQPFL